ncbi:hypothetical protein [Flagellimonas alvinocaridis]|uniref:hypothetical protein n=1 Tax=Flagellimonas alvinocaridis TaxID=2530200 RepID=UPI001F2E27FC|nr:hypothetical protein [Allomuricauda alvinocaridis]
MRTSLTLLVLISILFSCKQQEKNKVSDENASINKISPVEKGEVHVLTKSMEFIAADTLLAGWNTFIYENQSTEVHFILLDKYPEGKTVANTKAEVIPPFDEGMKLIMEGDMDNAVAAFGKLPEWFHQIKFCGGTGFISPKHTTQSTVYLEPGRYAMECYVKMFNGEWHTSHGMIKEFMVSDKTTTLSQPKPTATIDISSTAGIILKDSLSQGKQIIETNFLDQKAYEHFVGHDINLVKYEDNASMDSLLLWMNWMNPRGLRSPSPEGFTFLGGMNNLSAGDKGYFEADLVPGNYVIISEVPEADTKKLMYTFTIK